MSRSEYDANIQEGFVQRQHEPLAPAGGTGAAGPAAAALTA